MPFWLLNLVTYGFPGNIHFGRTGVLHDSPGPVCSKQDGKGRVRSNTRVIHPEWFFNISNPQLHLTIKHIDTLYFYHFINVNWNLWSLWFMFSIMFRYYFLSIWLNPSWLETFRKGTPSLLVYTGGTFCQSACAAWSFTFYV